MFVLRCEAPFSRGRHKFHVLLYYVPWKSIEKESQVETKVGAPNKCTTPFQFQRRLCLNLETSILGLLWTQANERQKEETASLRKRSRRGLFLTTPF